MQIQSSSTSIEQIASFIRRLDKRDKVRLVQLVPELAFVQTDMSSDEISEEQQALTSFFDAYAEADAMPLPESEEFVQGLTFAEFFALPENEQSSVWRLAHASAETSSLASG